MLIARNIHKSYGQLHVLKGIDVEIQAKEVVSIVGASGAGKSTLLHILGSLDHPDQGAVSLNGVDLVGLNNRKLAQFRNAHIGFIFQFHNLLPEFSSLENVCMPGFIKGTRSGEVRKRAGELLELLGISPRADHKPSELSGGEQQRVSVARALINRPTIVFADEPSGNLDSTNANDLHQLFFKLREELGQTFVVVTHNKDLAGMADRRLVMEDGKMR